LLNRLRLAGFEYRHPDLPWLTAEAIRFLTFWLKPDDKVLEFGSGRSTAWLAGRCRVVTSIEHDQAWFQAMSGRLSAFENVDYRFAPLKDASQNDSPYLRTFSELTEDCYDVLLNDGRFRCQVACEGIARLRSGGLHVLDNAERYIPNHLEIPESRRFAEPTSDWARFIETTKDWRRVWTSNGVTATLLMFKPC
jgi:predicted O-methyltransferase YrrM